MLTIDMKYMFVFVMKCLLLSLILLKLLTVKFLKERFLKKNGLSFLWSSILNAFKGAFNCSSQKSTLRNLLNDMNDCLCTVISRKVVLQKHKT